MIHLAKTSPIRFAAAGLVSAVISINFKNHLLIQGAIFGVVIVLYLVLFEGILTPVRFAAFLFACTASFPVSILGTIVFGIRTSQSTDISLFELFFGGGVGAFVVLLSGILLFGPPQMRGEALGVALLSSFGGSILGFLGGALNIALGQHRSGDVGYTVFIFWQSGVALILGLLLAWGKKRWEPAPGTPPK